MHHLTADDKALILALRIEKHWHVDKMILEQWNRQTLYYLVGKLIKLEVLQGCLAVAGLARSAKS